MNNPRKYPKIIAHRGASAHAPENTLPAFQLALEQGADGIELDVMLSKDNRLIVIHDSTWNAAPTGKATCLTTVTPSSRNLTRVLTLAMPSKHAPPSAA